MAKLTKGDVDHVARLAKLQLSEEEKAKYLKQLSKIVDFVKELSEVKTSGLEATSQTTGLRNVYREDEIVPTQGLSQEDALSGAKRVQSGYFTVEAILKRKTDK
ncbi:Asp-tRNA(Asn)/Glu-tRNA(Gln) amidotransferase subunit GatC [Candidatus Woesebacteria bacterium]|nr:Asp-tRNA(Asn)/Glu-tRNA(Gln) amidotransferase subunit GatC [Candidatus Woesebacteria bacterium]